MMYQYEILRQLIIEHVPDITALQRGCEIEVSYDILHTRKIKEVTVVDRKSVYAIIAGSKSRLGNRIKKDYIVKIIGRDPTLCDVLKAVNAKYKTTKKMIGVKADGTIMKSEAGSEMVNTKYVWDFEKTLKGQSEKFKDFLLLTLYEGERKNQPHEYEM